MIRFRRLVTLIVVALVPVRAHGQAAPRVAATPSDTAIALESALAQLRAAQWFTGAYIGPSAVVPSEVRAWQVVLRSRAADSAFKVLLQTGTPAGQLYALTGVYLTDSAYFQRHLVEYEARVESVRILDGCLDMSAPFGAFVPYLADGRWSREFRAVKAAQ